MAAPTAASGSRKVRVQRSSMPCSSPQTSQSAAPIAGAAASSMSQAMVRSSVRRARGPPVSHSEAMMLDAAIERAAAHTQLLRRGHYVAGVFGQDLTNEGALRFFEGLVVRAGGVRPGHESQVLRGDAIAAGQ